MNEHGYQWFWYHMGEIGTELDSIITVPGIKDDI